MGPVNGAAASPSETGPSIIYGREDDEAGGIQLSAVAVAVAVSK